MPVDERAPALLRQLVQWKEASFHARGKQTYWETHPQVARNLQALLRRRGEIRLTSIDGEMAALSFNFPVGTSVCAQQAAVQPGFDRYGLSLLATTGTSVTRSPEASGVSTCSGQRGIQVPLGARPHRAHSPLGSPEPRAISRLWSLDGSGRRTPPSAGRLLAGTTPCRPHAQESRGGQELVSRARVSVSTCCSGAAQCLSEREEPSRFAAE